MSDVLQNALVGHYAKSLGLLTEQDINTAILLEWKKLINTLYNQALEISNQDWSNPTELKHCSCKDPIWDTIKYVYDAIGLVNGHPLQRNTDLVCLIVAYAVKNCIHSEDVHHSSREDAFRLKFESFMAREIIAQRCKSPNILEDEQLDQRYIRSLRKHNPKKNRSIVIGKGKIDFSQITHEGYEKVNLIAKHPYTYEKHINDNDKLLGEHYVLYSFGKISHDDYVQSWARVLQELGLKPTDKGIEFLSEVLDIRMKSIMYKNIFEEPVISPRDVIRMKFYQELYQSLKDILDEKHIIKIAKIQSDLDDESTLYIYKGRTSCHTRNHTMKSATAIFIGRNDSEIKLNVEHCPLCKKFYLSFSLYERYREKYSVLLGKIKMDSSSICDVPNILLSEFSPLKLCGYSVNQQDGCSKIERQYIISKVIEKGILTKNEVIYYLEHFINMNGQKANNAVALEKWKEDLDFTLKYKMSEQDEYKLKHVKKY